MKTLKITTTMIICFVLTTAVNQKIFSQDKTEKTIGVAKIKANVKCGNCKSQIEKNIAFEKGVKSVVADVEAKTVTIEYIKEKNSSEKLLEALKKLGYKDAELITTSAKTNAGYKCCPKPCDKSKKSCKDTVK